MFVFAARPATARLVTAGWCIIRSCHHKGFYRPGVFNLEHLSLTSRITIGCKEMGVRIDPPPGALHDTWPVAAYRDVR